jgi:hypothetical protein
MASNRLNLFFRPRETGATGNVQSLHFLVFWMQNVLPLAPMAASGKTAEATTHLWAAQSLTLGTRLIRVRTTRRSAMNAAYF